MFVFTLPILDLIGLVIAAILIIGCLVYAYASTLMQERIQAQRLRARRTPTGPAIPDAPFLES